MLNLFLNHLKLEGCSKNYILNSIENMEVQKVVAYIQGEIVTFLLQQKTTNTTIVVFRCFL